VDNPKEGEMADNTKIEWAEASWSPITGCSPISEGCTNCYARRMAQRLKGRYGYPKDDPFRVTFHPDRLNEPFKWKKPRHIFVCSMGDLWHKDIDWSLIDQVLEICVESQHHTFLLLTKRIEAAWYYFKSPMYSAPKHYRREFLDLANLWLGVTAENQQRADERIPILLQIPAAKHFVSIEPMLEPVDISQTVTYWDDPLAGISWVIAGCESGPNRRAAKIEWFRDLKNQCVEADIPFFIKQTNGYINGKSQVVKMPILDGREWNEVPK